MLEINNLDVFYGKVQALFDVSIKVEHNEIVSIIGSNGAGKTTLMNTIVGVNKTAKGEIKYKDEVISNLPTHKLVEKGIIYVPEGRRIFYNMSVLENIEIGGYSRRLSQKQFSGELETIVAIFPRLKERLNQKGGTLSGGEQQMLAIARGLLGDPKLLLLDEPSLGLAPIIVNEVFDVIVNINKMKNIPIILVEQNAYMALNISSTAYVLELGHIKHQGRSSELIESPEIKKAYLGEG